MIIKVCGMREKENMLAVAALQPDMLGFIFYPRSPRYMGDSLQPADLQELPSAITKVGVFVYEDTERIISTAIKYALQVVQLHGKAGPEVCREVRNTGLQVIRAEGINADTDWERIAAYSPDCDYMLFDTASEKYGGTGISFDWSLLQRYTGKTPFLLSGGIGPTDVQAVNRFSHPSLAGVDVNSRFEIAPGIKDVEKLRKFVTAFRQPQLRTVNPKL